MSFQVSVIEGVRGQ